MKNSLILLSLILFSACSTQLKYSMNNSKFITPESTGKFLKGDLGISYQMTHKVVISEAFDPLIFNLPAITSNVDQISIGGEVSLPIDLGLLEKLDFYTIDGKYGFKYQLIGTPELAKEAGYKGAFAVAYGYDHPDSSEVVYTSGTTTRTLKTDMKVKSIETSLLFGKRIDEKNLFYFNIFHDRYTYDGSLSSSQFTTINAKGKSSNTALLIGYELSSDNKDKFGAKIKLEGGVAQGQLDQFDKRTSGVLGSVISMTW